MTQKNKPKYDETFRQGVMGGVLGMFVGAPGLGMVLGVAHANKDKIKKFGEHVNKHTSVKRQT